MSIYSGSVMNVDNLKKIIHVSHFENWASFLHNPTDQTHLRVKYLTTSLSAYKTESKQHKHSHSLGLQVNSCPEFKLPW